MLHFTGYSNIFSKKYGQTQLLSKYVIIVIHFSKTIIIYLFIVLLIKKYYLIFSAQCTSLLR